MLKQKKREWKEKKCPLYVVAFGLASLPPFSPSSIGWEAGAIELAPLAAAWVVSLRGKGKKTFSGFLNLDAESTSTTFKAST